MYGIGDTKITADPEDEPSDETVIYRPKKDEKEEKTVLKNKKKEASNIDEETFKLMQENQKLTASYRELISFLKKLLNNCINDPQTYIAVFIMQKEGSARLDFIQNIEYKYIELLSLDFVNSPDETIRKQINYKYNAVRTKLELVQNRIKAISNIVKVKNPSLLLQIQKAPAKLNKSSRAGNFTMTK